MHDQIDEYSLIVGRITPNDILSMPVCVFRPKKGLENKWLIFSQDFQLHLQVLDLRFHVVQLGEKSSAVSVFRYFRLLYLIRRGTVLGYHILCDTGELHIAMVDSVLNELVRGLFRDNSYLRPRHISGLLAVVAMACNVKLKSEKCISSRLSEKFGKLWIGAEVMLFVLVGAAVDIRYTLSAGGMAVLMILIALTFRAVGVFLCLFGTDLNKKERIFCVIAYIPKATVQAAIGSVPMSLGLPCGKIVLSVAVLAILITAPLGAIGIDFTSHKILEKEKP